MAAQALRKALPDTADTDGIGYASYPPGVAHEIDVSRYESIVVSFDACVATFSERVAGEGMVRIAVHGRDRNRAHTAAALSHSPAGTPQYYAKKQTLGLDLRHPYFRSVAAYDESGQMFERIVIDKIEPTTFDAGVFDPKNPDYKF